MCKTGKQSRVVTRWYNAVLCRLSNISTPSCAATATSLVQLPDLLHENDYTVPPRVMPPLSNLLSVQSRILYQAINGVQNT